MLPLNYAILRLFLDTDEADVDQVIEALGSDYKNFRQFTPKSITETLMTAEANGLLEETRYHLDSDQRLHVYYRTTDTGRSMIERYIKAPSSLAHGQATRNNNGHGA